MENITIDIEQQSMQLSKQFTTDAKVLLATAHEIEIDCPELYELACDELRIVKAKAKDLDERRRAITRPLDESKARIMDLFRPAQEFLQQTEAAYKASMVRWQTEQERLRREEEARQREATRKEVALMLAEARARLEAGHVEQAEAISMSAELIPMPIVSSRVEKVTGISMRTVWKAEVTDKLALIKAVAAGLVPDAVLVVDMVVLNAQARALKSAFNYPGVKAATEQTIAASRRTGEVA